MSGSSPVRTRQPKSVTRSTILRRAYDMYLARELEPGDERLSVVLDSLGYTTGAGYQIWENQGAFRRDLSVFISENIQYGTLRPLFDSVAELASSGLPVRDCMLGAGNDYMRTNLDREEFFLTLRFFAMREDRPDEITKALRGAYDRSSREGEELFTKALKELGRAIKPSLEVQDLITAVAALVEGYALRSRVQPEKIRDAIPIGDQEHHAFSLAFLALVSDFTEPLPA